MVDSSGVLVDDIRCCNSRSQVTLDSLPTNHAIGIVREVVTQLVVGLVEVRRSLRTLRSSCNTPALVIIGPIIKKDISVNSNIITVIY